MNEQMNEQKPERGSPEHRDRVGLRKLGDPAGFRFYSWEAFDVGDVAIVKMVGCVVTKFITRGPRKGRPKYDGEPRTVYVSEAEMVAECARWEAETGKCGRCMGVGQEWAGWSSDTGTRTETCRRCSGSGSKP